MQELVLPISVNIAGPIWIVVAQFCRMDLHHVVLLLVWLPMN